MGQPENNAPPGPVDTQPLAWWRSGLGRWLVRGIYGLVMAGLLCVWLRQNLTLETEVRIVDDRGQPIEGAEVKLLGLMSKDKFYHWGWDETQHGPVGPFKSDVRGVVAFGYPRYLFEEIETAEVNVEVRHDGFSPLVARHMVAIQPPANAGMKAQIEFWGQIIWARLHGRSGAKDLVLERSAMFELTATLNGRRVNPARLLAVVKGIDSLKRRESWKAGADGVLRSSQLPIKYPVSFFLAYVPEDGRVYNSPLETCSTSPGQTNRFDLKLTAGVRVEGRLSETVPRPVRNGQVNAWCVVGGIPWETWTTVDEAGNFVFESLPSRQVELAGRCDGYVSASGGARRNSIFQAQRITLATQHGEVTLLMTPEARCEVEVRDPEGRPLAGATVYFQPGMSYTSAYTVFPGGKYRAEDVLVEEKVRRYVQRFPYSYLARTGTDGKAFIEGLPPTQQEYTVGHEDYVMPVNPATTNGFRYATVILSSGVTAQETVRMERKP